MVILMYMNIVAHLPGTKFQDKNGNWDIGQFVAGIQMILKLFYLQFSVVILQHNARIGQH